MSRQVPADHREVLGKLGQCRAPQGTDAGSQGGTDDEHRLPTGGQILRGTGEQGWGQLRDGGLLQVHRVLSAV